jgi:hypothetical protein
MYARTMILAVAAILVAAVIPAQAGSSSYDDFEDGAISTTLWTVSTSNGSVTEENGYLEVWGGPHTNPHSGNTGEAWVVAQAVDFKHVPAAEVLFEMYWWKNYIMGYNNASLDIIDGTDVITIKTFDSDIASSESGGGSFKLVFDGYSAQLLKDGAPVTGFVDLSPLNSYYLRFYCWENQPYGSWMTNNPSWPHATIMQIQEISYVPEPATLSLLVIGGLAMLRRRKSRRAGNSLPAESSREH